MNKKVIAAVVIVLILIAGVAAGVILVGQKQLFQQKAAPATRLSLSASTIAPEEETDFTVFVNIETSENRVIGAELYINYDASILELKTASPGTFFTNPRALQPSIDNSLGTLSYTLFLEPGADPAQGSGIVATLLFGAKKAGSSSVGFSQDTIVAAVGEAGQNVLVESVPLTIQVQQKTAEVPTATPVPTIAEIGGTDITGDGNLAQAGTSPTSTPVQTITSTPSPTDVPVVIPVDQDPPIPESGVSYPTIYALFLSAALIILSVVILKRS